MYFLTIHKNYNDLAIYFEGMKSYEFYIENTYLQNIEFIKELILL